MYVNPINPSEAFLYPVEMELSRMARFPFIGILPGGCKVILGTGQTLIAFVVGIIAYVIPKWHHLHDLHQYSWIHIKHGLVNISTGIAEGIPFLGLYLYYKFNRKEGYQAYPYLTLPLTDLKITPERKAEIPKFQELLKSYNSKELSIAYEDMLENKLISFTPFLEHLDSSIREKWIFSHQDTKELIEMMKMLVKLGADINAVPLLGTLTLAISKNYTHHLDRNSPSYLIELFKTALILKANPNNNQFYSFYHNPIDEIVRTGDSELIECLYLANAKFNTDSLIETLNSTNIEWRTPGQMLQALLQLMNYGVDYQLSKEVIEKIRAKRGLIISSNFELILAFRDNFQNKQLLLYKALIVSVKCDYINTAKILINKSLTFSEKEKKGIIQMAFRQSIESNSVKCFEYLINDYEIEISTFKVTMSALRQRTNHQIHPNIIKAYEKYLDKYKEKVKEPLPDVLADVVISYL